MNTLKRISTKLGTVALVAGSILTQGVTLAFAAPAFTDNGSQIHVNGDPSTFNNPPTNSSISGFISSFGSQILNIVLLLIGIIAVLYLVFYGFQYITAGGDPEKSKKARSGIINAIIGIIVVALAFTIVRFAINASGAGGNLLNNAGGTSSGGGTVLNP